MDSQQLQQANEALKLAEQDLIKEQEWMDKEAYFLAFTHVSFDHYREQMRLVREKMNNTEYNKYGQPKP